MAKLARGRLREKQEQLEQALHGRMGDHQRFMLLTSCGTSTNWIS